MASDEEVIKSDDVPEVAQNVAVPSDQPTQAKDRPNLRPKFNSDSQFKIMTSYPENSSTCLSPLT